MPADTTETVVDQSARLQPSINLHASVTAFMFSCSGTQCTPEGWRPRVSPVQWSKPHSILAPLRIWTRATGSKIISGDHYTTSRIFVHDFCVNRFHVEEPIFLNFGKLNISRPRFDKNFGHFRKWGQSLFSESPGNLNHFCQILAHIKNSSYSQTSPPRFDANSAGSGVQITARGQLEIRVRF